MRVFDTLNAQTATVIDIRAGLLSPTLHCSPISAFSIPRNTRSRVLHVLGNNQRRSTKSSRSRRLAAGAAYRRRQPHQRDEIRVSGRRARHSDVERAAAEAVDKSNMPFSVFARERSSAVLRGTVGTWLDRVFAQFARVRLP
jgi:hypothetical protein